MKDFEFEDRLQDSLLIEESEEGCMIHCEGFGDGESACVEIPFEKFPEIIDWFEKCLDRFENQQKRNIAAKALEDLGGMAMDKYITANDCIRDRHNFVVEMLKEIAK